MQRKLTKQLLALFLVFIMILQTTLGVYAKSVTLDRTTAMSSYLTVLEHTDNLGAHHDEQGKRVFKIDGQYAYCIESDVGLSHDKIYQDGQDAKDILSSKPNHLTSWDEKYEMISILLSLVPTTILTNNKAEHIRWLVGQTMLWEITGEERGSHFVYVGNSRAGSSAYRDCYQWDDIKDEKAFWDEYHALEKQILSYWIIPSFMSSLQNQKTLTLTQYDGTYYYDTFTDSHNVLDHYDFSGTDLTCQVNGDKLTIKSKFVKDAQLCATLKSNYKLKAPLFWSDGNYQRTVTASNLSDAAYKAYALVQVAKGHLEIIKKDCFDQALENAIFEITSPHCTKSNYTTNQEGKIELTLECGKYSIREVFAPHGYTIHDSTFEMIVYPNQTTSQVIKNDEPMGSIELRKTIDCSLTQGFQGDAFLKDNEYALYALEDITNYAGTHTFFHKDQLIAKALTNEEGKLLFSSLHLGKYYIKETKSNDSLLLDSQTYNVTLTYQDMHTSIVSETVNTTNKVNSQRVQIFKQGKTSIGVSSGLQGAEFTFVLESEYQEVGFEKATKYYVGQTDQNGFLTTCLLPYGHYRVRETKVPDGYYGASDFYITIDKDTQDYELGYEIKKVTVSNQAFESLLKIVKKDQKTGEVVFNKKATFKIKNLDTNEYVSYTDWSAFPQIHVDQWTTHDDGTITLNTLLQAGHYQLEEIVSPDGYILNTEPLKFTISKDHYEISEDGHTPITIVEFYNQSSQGQIQIVKQGEVCVDFEDGHFVYETRGLKDVEFGIYAREDILSPSEHIIYKKGELVEKIVSDENGKATSSLLPLGTYECQELTAHFGYVIDDERHIVTLLANGQEIVCKTISITNPRQKISICVSKQDDKTNEYLENAEFSLYANRDIYNIDGKIIVEEGTMIETVKSNAKERVFFISDLPIDLTPEYAVMPIFDTEFIGDDHSLYKVEETKVPDGYVSRNVTFYIDGKYTQQDEETLTYSYDFINEKTHCRIHKVDEESHDLSGAKLQILDSVTKEVITEWMTQDNAYLIDGLIVGRSYILHEEYAPEGYDLSEDMMFTVQDTSEIQEIYFVNKKTPIVIVPPVTPPVEVPNTSDSTQWITYCLMMIDVIFILMMLRKKEA